MIKLMDRFLARNGSIICFLPQFFCQGVTLLTGKSNTIFMYDKYFGQRHFSDLKTPLYIATTDLLTGSTIFYSSGELAKAYCSF